MRNQTGEFEGREGKKLFYQFWLPESGTVKANIVAIHDLCVHSDRLKHSAEYLTEQEYEIYAFDLRGHWRNTGEISGHIDTMDHLQKDIVLFMDIVKKPSENKKTFLMGEGFGGLVSLIYATTHPALSGVIAISPELGLAKDSSLGKKVSKKIAGSTKMLEYEVDQKLLTSDLKILKEFNTDKNRLKEISAKTASERDSSMKWAMDNASKLICSTLIMQAGNDRLVDKKTSKEFFDNIKGKDKTYKEYSGFFHDLLNEKGRAQVYQDIYVWLEKHKSVP